MEVFHKSRNLPRWNNNHKMFFHIMKGLSKVIEINKQIED